MGAKTKKATPTGDCYDAALKYAAFEVPKDDRDRYQVVHGYPTGTGGDIVGIKHGHAWIERTDPPPADLPEQFKRVDPSFWITVIDKSNGKDLELPRSLYYGVGRIDPADCRYYTVAEAMALAVEHEHWGPWPA